MLTRRRRYALVGLVASAAMCLSISAPTRADYYPNNYHLTYGVAGQQFWIGPDAIPNDNAIINAVQSWNAASGKVSYSRTTVQGNSRLDFTYPGTGNYCARTQFFVNTTNVTGPNGAPTSNYWWAKIQLSGYFNNTSTCGPVSHRRGILAHEMGHAFGLTHSEGPPVTLMTASLAAPWNYTLNDPQPVDVQEVNALY